MRKEKLLKVLKEKKVKLECRKRRFELWQEQLENEPITETNLMKTGIHWNKQRRLEDRIEEIDTKISNVEKSRYGLQVFMYRRAINEN